MILWVLLILDFNPLFYPYINIFNPRGLLIYSRNNEGKLDVFTRTLLPWKHTLHEHLSTEYPLRTIHQKYKNIVNCVPNSPQSTEGKGQLQKLVKATGTKYSFRIHPAWTQRQECCTLPGA